MNDLRFFECKVVTEDETGKLITTNLITAGHDYAEAAERIEHCFGCDLVSFQIRDSLELNTYTTGDCIEFHFE